MLQKKLEHLKNILNQLNMKVEAQNAVFAWILRNKNTIVIREAQAYEGEFPNFKGCFYRPLSRLSIVCWMILQHEQNFIEKKIPYSLFLDTMSDIILRQTIYDYKYHQYGISKNDFIWFRHLYHFHLFKIGCLQYQIFHMVYLDEECLGYPYIQFKSGQKESLPPQANVINVHIQKYANLSPHLISHSFQQAEHFFNTYFPNHPTKTFVCYSWLLYPNNQKILPLTSRILQFSKQFQIIGFVQDNTQAIENIYGKRYRKISDYPQFTTLQKSGLHHRDKLGFACGIRSFHQT